MAFHVVLFGFVVFFLFHNLMNTSVKRVTCMYVSVFWGLSFFHFLIAELYLELSSVTS